MEVLFLRVNLALNALSRWIN